MSIPGNTSEKMHNNSS